MDDVLLTANRCLVLRDLVFELGGIASTSSSVEELDGLVDNMVSKGIPSDPSENLLRWIHTHRNQSGCKITQLLGVDVAKVLVPDCFGTFYDKAAPECKLCLDRQQCKEKFLAADRKGKAVEIPDSRIDQAYPVSKRVNTDDVRDLLRGKMGQIAKTLASGQKVVLLIDPKTSQPKVLVSTFTPNLASEEAEEQEPTMATTKTKPDTKGKKATAADEEDEEEATPKTTKKGSAAAKAPAKSKAVVAEDDDEEEEEEDEAPAPKPTKKAKAAPVEDDEEEEADDEAGEDEEEEDEAPKSKKFKPAKEAKPEKKAKKAEPKAVQEFQARLKTDLKEDSALFKFAKKLGVTWTKKEDARINRMLCVMACKKFIAENA